MSEQLSFEDLWFAEDDFRTFMTCLDTARREITRLNEEISELRQAYRDKLPVRAIETAHKVETARKRLAEHPKEPLPYAEQSRLEALVRAHLEARAEETRQALEEVRERLGVPDMTGGGAAVS